MSDIVSNHGINVIFALSAVIFYVALGVHFWRQRLNMVQSGATEEDIEMYMAFRFTRLGRAFGVLAILTWPIWVCVARVLYAASWVSERVKALS